MINWAELEAELQRTRLDRRSWIALELANQWCGTGVPIRFLEPPADLRMAVFERQMLNWKLRRPFARLPTRILWAGSWRAAAATSANLLARQLARMIALTRRPLLVQLAGGRGSTPPGLRKGPCSPSTLTRASPPSLDDATTPIGHRPQSGCRCRPWPACLVTGPGGYWMQAAYGGHFTRLKPLATLLRLPSRSCSGSGLTRCSSLVATARSTRSSTAWWPQPSRNRLQHSIRAACREARVVLMLPPTNRGLGVIPVGHGNDFASHSDFRSATPADAFRVVLDGITRSVDVGRVNGRCFVNGVGIGLDGFIALEVRRTRRLPGILMYLVAVVRGLRTYHNATVRITCDGRTDERELPGQRDELPVPWWGFWICPHALVDDGLLDVCIADAMPTARLDPSRRTSNARHARREARHLVRHGAARHDRG